MKKLILSVAMLCVTGTLLAQTSAYEHLPRAESASVETAASVAPCDDCSISQVATRTYTGEENNSDIHQTGSMNSANAFQLGTGNHSLITQEGDDVYLGEGGTLNSAVVYQEGMHNYSDISQLGDNNMGQVIQMGEDNYASQVVGAGWAENNDAYVYQDGTGNASSQSQFYDNNEALISQNGDNNDAIQYQSSNLDQGAGSFASIIQSGDDNAAEETQAGSNNYAFVDQQGDRNISKGDQVSDSSMGSYWTNNYRVLQVGDDNMSCSTQTTTDRYQYNYVSQLGNSNKAVVDQTATAGGSYVANYSFITQNGSMNTACVQQNNTAAN